MESKEESNLVEQLNSILGNMVTKKSYEHDRLMGNSRINEKIKELEKSNRELSEELLSMSVRESNTRDWVQNQIKELTGIEQDQELKKGSFSDRVYFIKCSDKIKIGISKSPKHRLQGLQTANPYKLELLADFEALGGYEKSLHEIYDKYRMLGEWFELNYQILKDIETMKEIGLKEFINEKEKKDESNI